MKIETRYNIGDIFWTVELVKSEPTHGVYHIGTRGPWEIIGVVARGEHLYYEFDKKMGSWDAHEFERKIDEGEGEWCTSIHEAADWIRNNCDSILEEINKEG